MVAAEKYKNIKWTKQEKNQNENKNQSVYYSARVRKNVLCVEYISIDETLEIKWSISSVQRGTGLLFFHLSKSVPIL